MKLEKGMKIRQTMTTTNPMLKNTTWNESLVFEVLKVNKKSYSLLCVEGYLEGSIVKLSKDFKPESDTVFGYTKYEIV